MDTYENLTQRLGTRSTSVLYLFKLKNYRLNSFALPQ